MELETYIKLAEFTSGERMTILTATRKIALQLGFTEVVQKVDEALAHERMTRAFDERWAGKRTGRLYGPRVIEIDNLVDPVLGSIRDIAVSHTKGLPTNDDLVVQVNEMLADLFPAGLAAVVSMSCVDQVAATEDIVEKLQTTHATLAGELGLTRRVAYLAELAVKYREAVVNDRELTFPEVKAMRTIGQTMLCEMVAIILGRLANSRDPVQVAQRRELLEPLGIETRRVRKRRARRRGRGTETDGDVGDVDVGDVDAGDVDAGDVDAGDVDVVDEDVVDEDEDLAAMGEDEGEALAELGPDRE